MEPTTPRQAAFTLLTLVIDYKGDDAGRLAMLNRSLLQDLDEIPTDEGRGKFLMDVAAHLSAVAAGLAHAVADFHGRPVEDLIASLAVADER